MGNDYCRDSKLSKKVTGRKVPLMATDKALGSSLSKVMLKGDMNWTDFSLSQTLKQALLSRASSFSLFIRSGEKPVHVRRDGAFKHF